MRSFSKKIIGRLFAVGSVDYIKRKFGAGYNLIIQSRFFSLKKNSNDHYL